MSTPTFKGSHEEDFDSSTEESALHVWGWDQRLQPCQGTPVRHSVWHSWIWLNIHRLCTTGPSASSGREWWGKGKGCCSVRGSEGGLAFSQEGRGGRYSRYLSGFVWNLAWAVGLQLTCQTLSKHPVLQGNQSSCVQGQGGSPEPGTLNSEVEV